MLLLQFEVRKTQYTGLWKTDLIGAICADPCCELHPLYAGLSHFQYQLRFCSLQWVESSAQTFIAHKIQQCLVKHHCIFLLMDLSRLDPMKMETHQCKVSSAKVIAKSCSLVASSILLEWERDLGVLIADVTSCMQIVSLLFYGKPLYPSCSFRSECSRLKDSICFEDFALSKTMSPAAALHASLTMCGSVCFTTTWAGEASYPIRQGSDHLVLRIFTASPYLLLPLSSWDLVASFLTRNPLESGYPQSNCCLQDSCSKAAILSLCLPLTELSANWISILEPKPIA